MKLPNKEISNLIDKKDIEKIALFLHEKNFKYFSSHVHSTREYRKELILYFDSIEKIYINIYDSEAYEIFLKSLIILTINYEKNYDKYLVDEITKNKLYNWFINYFPLETLLKFDR